MNEKAVEHQETRETIIPVRKYPYYIEKPPTENRVGRFLEAFAAVLKYSDYKPLLDSYCTSNTKCNRCAVACPVFLATGDPRDIPCYRTNLILDIYKRYFTIGGAIKARLTNGFELTEEIIDDMLDGFYRCTACRRCTRECPLGVDHGLITRLARYVLSLIGIVPKALQVSVREQLEGTTHNTSKVPKEALINTLEFLSEELEDLLGVKMTFPVDRPGREYVFFCAVSDYLLEPETLMGNAAVLYAAGDWDKWTVGTHNYDGINYGLFYSDWHLENIIKQLVAEVTRLKGEKILIGECGHASRSAHDFVPVFAGKEAYPVTNFMEYTLKCIQEGRIKLDRDIVTKRVTYHDPCNIARSGWIVQQPREILKAFVNDFVEMKPSGQDNYCCGGGGGLVSIDEIHEFRMSVAGKIKAEQLRQTGAEICIAPCANCKKQLKELVEYYKIPCTVMGLHDLILKAIHIPGGKSPQERKEEAALMEM
ncbi:MAG: (Fe-S)-binding protein [candidate division Zixibacteria bacterium]|nr:(Fe-S)-binding protein [candidate division Zixibacteria bacterium]